MASSYKLKLEKRSKEEDEAHTRAKAAEEALVAQVKVVNSGLKDLRRFTSLTQRALDKLVHESDAVFKQVAVRYATLTNAFVEDLPAHTRKLAADASMVDNKDDVRAFVDRTSSGARWYRIPFAFEPYEMDAEAKAYLGTTGEPGAAAAAAAKASEANVVLHKFRKSVQAALCSHCGSVVFTGLQCTECRTVCHKACVEKLKVHCEKQAGPPAPKTFQVIGVPLARQPKSPDHPDIPVLVVTCIRAIVRRGVHHEGLYRVAGTRRVRAKAAGRGGAGIGGVTACVRRALSRGRTRHQVGHGKAVLAVRGARQPARHGRHGLRRGRARHHGLPQDVLPPGACGAVCRWARGREVRRLTGECGHPWRRYAWVAAAGAPDPLRALQRHDRGRLAEQGHRQPRRAQPRTRARAPRRWPHAD